MNALEIGINIVVALVAVMLVAIPIITMLKIKEHKQGLRDPKNRK